MPGPGTGRAGVVEAAAHRSEHSAPRFRVPRGRRLIMSISLYRRRIAATAIQLAKGRSVPGQEVIARLRRVGRDRNRRSGPGPDRRPLDEDCRGKMAARRVTSPASNARVAFTPWLSPFRRSSPSRSGRSSFSVPVHRVNACSMSSRVRAPSKSRPSFGRHRFRRA